MQEPKAAYHLKGDRSKMIIWIDSEDGTRGGSIYLKRCHQSALEEGQLSRFIHTGPLRKKIDVILGSWWSGDEIRGTVPREIPTLIWCRRKRGYVQSPAEEWSMCSRIAMKVFLRTSGCSAACVSVTTRESAKREGFGVLDVEYTKIHKGRDLRNTKMSDKKNKKVVFVVMDNGLIDKGYLRHLSIIDSISSSHNVIVEVYGSAKRVDYGNRSEARYNGFKEKPFEDAKEKNTGEYVFYLGCSRYEGLHMAVVEASMVGIPSVLSDIPAHRELQEISGEKLLLGKCARDNIEILRQILNERSYELESNKCGNLYNRFGNADNKRGEGVGK